MNPQGVHPAGVNTPHEADRVAIVEWIRDARRRGLRPRTLSTRRRSLATASRLLPQGLMCADVDDLAGWEDYVLDRVSSATRVNYVVALRVFYRWAVAEGRLEADPSVKLATPKTQPRLPKPLPAAEAMARCSSRRQGCGVVR